MKNKQFNEIATDHFLLISIHLSVTIHHFKMNIADDDVMPDHDISNKHALNLLHYNDVTKFFIALWK